jgi:NAD(P)-dependent dehydrogenase (short-subunit alcohol dehydrogenase family)
MTMNHLAGKHAVVSGGGTGSGAAIARALVGAGAKVTITGRRRAVLEKVAGDNPALRCVTADVTDARSVDAMLAEAASGFGPVDIAVANAGAAASKPFAKMDDGDLRAMLDVNLFGVFHLWQAALGPMRAAGWGRLIVIASIAGLKGAAYVSAYCAAKHAAVGMTRALAREVAPTGITVNAVCPGYMRSPMLEESIDNIMRRTGRSRAEAEAALLSTNPQGRFIDPEEVAQTVVWLCSPAAQSVNGQAISISGGEA